jgi:DNA-binding response OmpR family regulator
VVPKSAIESALSEFGREVSANAVEAVVSRTRKALADAGSRIVIETTRGIGYQLTEEQRA